MISYEIVMMNLVGGSLQTEEELIKCYAWVTMAKYF